MVNNHCIININIRIFCFSGNRSNLFLRRIIAWVFTAILIAPGVCASEADPLIVSRIRIEITGSTGDYQQWIQIADSLIYLEEGRPFRDDLFAKSVSALEACGLFVSIDIPDPDWSLPELDIVFRLTPLVRIKDIRISGGFPLLEKEIRNAMTIVTGDAYIPENFLHQETLIQSLFSAEGYIDPKVIITAGKDPDDGHYVMDVAIQKGPFYHVEAVNIEGNGAFSDTRIKMRMKTWQASLYYGGLSRFIQKELNQDIKTLRGFYRARGYADAAIDSNVEKDPQSGNVRIQIIVSEGPCYAVDFEGNEMFWGFSLKNDLVFFTEGNKNGLGIRKSIRNIEKRYRKDGYPEVRVTSKEAEPSDNGNLVRPLTFFIEEGPRYIVKNITIDGNRAFDDEKIMKQMITGLPGWLDAGQYVKEILDDDIRAINALYLESGYRNTGIDYRVDLQPSQQKPEMIDVAVVVSIEEGPKTSVSSVSIKGAIPISADSVAENLIMPPDSAFRQYLVKSERIALAARISEKGYPHVTVDPEITFGPDETFADVTYIINPGPYVEMGQAFFIGNFKTRDSIFIREMELQAKEPLSLAGLLASQRNIRNVNVVDAARFKTFGLDENGERVDMLCEIKERKPYFVELATGYDTQRLLYMKTAAGNSNLMGLNKELIVGLELSQIGYRADLELTEPRFLGTRILSATSLYTEEVEELNQNFGTRATGASQGFSRPLTRYLTASLNFQIENREQYRTDGQTIIEDEADLYDPRSILVTTPSLVYNSTDSFVRPTSGMRVSVSVDASSGLQNSLDNFFKYRLDTRYYYSPVKRLILALHGRFGYIDPFGGKSLIPDDQLFFLGGINDVRGFSENSLRFDANNDPVGGRTSILGSAEARIDVGMNFELAAFYDTGAIRDPLTDDGLNDFRSSVGLALRYITPIGPIGGMYGWKLDRKPGESPGAFHFAIGYTF
jgi:outer membrane protein insertion porin family